MLVEIPTRNDLPAYEQTVKLDGSSYILGVYFNPRMNDGQGKWMLILADQNRNMLVGPVPVVVSWNIIDRFIGRNPLPGTLFAFDTSGQNEDPGQFDLGSRVRLYYLEAGSTL